MDFNEKLKQLRQNRQWTQEELAERLFISRTAVSKWESGRGFPSIDSLKAISQDTIIFKLIIFSFVILTMLFGIFELAFSRREQRIIGSVSLILSLFGVLLFIMTRHPYPATYVLMLLAVKGISLLNSR